MAISRFAKFGAVGAVALAGAASFVMAQPAAERKVAPRPLPVVSPVVADASGKTPAQIVRDAEEAAMKKPVVVRDPIAGKPSIDLVFAIDCSGSMGGVIETAKQKVWTIVNEVGKAKPAPRLRIGLLGYGDGSRTFRRFDLSDDLDEVYKNLMTFKDEGWGEEYVGLVIQKSLNEMSWSQAATSLKIVYVVGNETAKQGPLDYEKTAPQATKQNVFVNAVYCGSSGGEETWREFSKLAEGRYLHIAGDGGAVVIDTPYDADLQKLGSGINKTYLRYGSRAEYGAQNQMAQDSAAETVGGAPTSAARAVAKSSAQYNNSSWDLLDASREPGFDIEKVKTEDLPAEMRAMTVAERKTHLQKKAQERAQIQEKIKTLGAQRAQYIEKKMKEDGKNPDKSFDDAVRRSLIDQAARAGFTFEK